MTLYQNKYLTESTRLKGYDYSLNGYYFITICTKNRERLFGRVDNGIMILNVFGHIVQNCWMDLPNHYPNLRLDAFIIMPDHIHAIFVIENDNAITTVETGLKPVSAIPSSQETGLKPVSTNAKRHGLFEFVRAFKTFSSRRINELRKTPGTPVWQIRFYDHIIRDPDSLTKIQEYILNNPINWAIDTENP